MKFNFLELKNKIYRYFSILMFVFFVVLVFGFNVKAFSLGKAESRSILLIQTYTTLDSEKPVQSGTGFIINYQGCLLTNSHIVSQNLDDDLFPYIYGVISEDIHYTPNNKIEYSVVYRNISRDLALLCPKVPTGDFYHYFEFVDSEEVSNYNFGDNVAIGGFPLIGGDTLTFNQGNIIGFWKNPALKSFLRLQYDFDELNMNLFKVDALTGPGGSGSPVFVDDEKNVLGIIFAASNSPGGISYLIAADTINSTLDMYYQQQRFNENMTSKDCVYNKETNLYTHNQQDYYDNLCNVARNINIEEIIQMNFDTRCVNKKLSTNRRYNATRYLLEGSNIDNWWSYLGILCVDNLKPIVNLNNGSKGITEPKEDKEIFSYGETRIDLQTEKEKAEELKKNLQEIFKGPIAVSSKNWSTLVNSYVYGKYPISAISQSIKFGGYTVHPTIPFVNWKNSDDYKNNINR